MKVELRKQIKAAKHLVLVIVSSFILLPSCFGRQATIYGYLSIATNAAPAGTQVLFTLQRTMDLYPIFLYRQAFTIPVTTNGYFVASNVLSGYYNITVGPSIDTVTIAVPNTTNAYNFLNLLDPTNVLTTVPSSFFLETNVMVENISGPESGLAASVSGSILTLTSTNVLAGGGSATNATLLNQVPGPLNLTFVNESGLSNGVAYAISGTNFTVYITNGSATTPGLLAAQGTAISNWANVAFATVSALNNTGAVITNGYNLLGAALTNWATTTFATITGMNNMGAAISNWANATFSTGGSSGVSSFGGQTGAITIDTAQLAMTGSELFASPMGTAITNFANLLGQACSNGYNLLGTAMTNWGNATFQPLNAILTTLSGSAAYDTVLGNPTGSAAAPTYTGNPVITNLTSLNSISNAGNLTNVQTVFAAGITISNATGLTNVGQTTSTVAFWTGSPPHLASGASYSGATLGTVTSAAAAADSAGVVSWSGTPITTSGTLTPTFSKMSSSQFGVGEVDNLTITASSGVIAASQMGAAITNFANTLGQAITNAAGSQASLFLWDTNINVSCVTNQIQTNGFHGTTANNYTNWWLNVGTNHTYRASLQTNNAAYCLTNIQGLIAGQDNWVDLYLQNTNSAANITLWWAQGTGAPPTGYISILNGSGFTNGLLITNSQGWYHLHGDIYGTNYMTNATWEVSWPNL
jgi:hypothetical protein